MLHPNIYQVKIIIYYGKASEHFHFIHQKYEILSQKYYSLGINKIRIKVTLNQNVQFEPKM